MWSGDGQSSLPGWQTQLLAVASLGVRQGVGRRDREPERDLVSLFLKALIPS